MLQFLFTRIMTAIPTLLLLVTVLVFTYPHGAGRSGAADVGRYGDGSQPCRPAAQHGAGSGHGTAVYYLVWQRACRVI